MLLQRAALSRSIPLGEAIEHRDQTHRKQMPSLERLLMAQEVKLHQEFIGDPAMQRSDDVGKGLVKGALAVCNRLCASQRACSLWNG